MKRLSSLCLVLLTTLASASTWYVRSATSCSNNGNGTSSACAASPGGVGGWKGFGNIVWGGAGIVAGDTLNLVGGDTYGEALTVGSSGTTNNYITITVSGVGAAIIDGAAIGNVGLRINDKSWIKIDGVAGNASAGDASSYKLRFINMLGSTGCIYENGSASHIVVLHMDCSGNDPGGAGGDDLAGVRLSSGGQWFEVGYNWIHGVTSDPPSSRWNVSCIEIWNADDGVTAYDRVLIHDNMCENLSEDGIKTSNQASMYNNIVRKVYLSGNHSDSLLIQNGSHAKIFNNLVDNSLQQCIYLDDTSSGVEKGDYWIYNNVINCPLSSSAINIDPEGVPGQNNGQISGVHILNNLLYGSAAYVIRGNGRGGTSYVHNLEIKNNILFPSTGGLLPLALSSDNTFVDANALDANLYSGFSSGAAIVAWTDGSNKTLAQLRALGREVHGSTSVLGPVFINAAGGDFHLSSGDTVARGMGLNLSSYFTTDKDGNPRPSFGAWDAGAYQSLNQYTVTASKSGTGTGTLTSSPAGISCGSTCSAPFDSGTSVTVSESALTGSFAGWGGTCGSCSGITILGEQSAEDNDICNNGACGSYIWFTPIVTPSSTSTVLSFHVPVSTVTLATNLKTAIYADSGGTPGTKLCESASTAAVAGDNVITPSSCPTLAASTTYWLANNQSGIGAKLGEVVSNPTCPGTSSSSKYDALLDAAYPAMPSPPAEAITAGLCLQQYVVLQSTATSCSFTVSANCTVTATFNLPLPTSCFTTSGGITTFGTLTASCANTGGPLTYSARTDLCVLGSEPSCVNGATTGQPGSALSFRMRDSDTIPFAARAPANTCAFDPDFNSYLCLATDWTTVNSHSVFHNGSAGQVDFFNANETQFIASLAGGNVVLLLIDRTKFLAHTCTTGSPCVTNTGIVAAGSGNGDATHFASSTVEAYSHHDPNSFYELETNGISVAKRVVTPNGASTTLSLPASSIYVDFSSDTPVPCSVVPSNFRYSGWTGIFAAGDGDEVGYALGGAPDWESGKAYPAATVVAGFVYPSTNNAGNYVFEATTPGTSGAGPVTWPQTQGLTVVDGGVTWTNRGKATGQEHGFFILVYEPLYGCTAVNTRTGQIFRGTSSALPAGTWQSDYSGVCNLFGGVTPCNLPDLMTLHAAKLSKSGRYMAGITPTGSETACSGGNGFTAGQCSCTRSGVQKYCDAYYFDLHTLYTRPCVDVSCDGHAAEGYNLDWRATHYTAHQMDNPTVAGNPGTANPGTQLSSLTWPADQHGVRSAVVSGDLQPIFLLVQDVPSKGRIGNGQTLAWYDTLVGGRPNGSNTMYNFAHTFNTGSNANFASQNGISVCGPMMGICSVPTDMMGTRGATDGTTPCNDLRGDYIWSNGGALALHDHLFINALTVYDVSVIGSGTMGTQPTWSTCASVGQTCTDAGGNQFTNLGTNNCRTDIMFVDPASAH